MALSASQVASLKTELTTDPLGLGYSQYFKTSHVNIANLLNATSGAGAATIQLQTISKGQLLLGIVPWLDQLSTGVTLTGSPVASGVSLKWQHRFQALQSADATLQISQILPLVTDVETDGLATAAQVSALTTKTGSRAEALFGAGTVIVWQDIFAAIGG